MSIITMNFESQYLKSNHAISIIMPNNPREISPKDFYASNKKYKVLWLLHGTYGDHTDWLRRTNIELYACERDLMVVMPSALNSNYSNWDKCMMGFGMYDYLTEELMPLIYNWLPASDKREDNFIAGLSMVVEEQSNLRLIIRINLRRQPFYPLLPWTFMGLQRSISIRRIFLHNV